jgi:hypothetical protein
MSPVHRCPGQARNDGRNDGTKQRGLLKRERSGHNFWPNTRGFQVGPPGSPKGRSCWLSGGWRADFHDARLGLFYEVGPTRIDGAQAPVQARRVVEKASTREKATMPAATAA